MPKRRQARLLVVLSLVLGGHIIVVWLLMSPRQFSVKSKPGSLQLVWIPAQAFPKTTPEHETAREKADKSVPRNRVQRTLAPPSVEPPPSDENNAIQPAPDWNEELRLAAKNALANQLAQKRHEGDFTHSFPVQSQKPAQFAWDYAATHRIEVLPQGGIVIHINDNCVLLLIPLPLVGCGIGKHPANGDLFQHRRDQ
jgi:hypothetical protein